MKVPSILRPSPDFQRLVARAGLAPKDVIARAPVSRATYFGWLNPLSQPSARRVGGMRPVNAWKIARVYAAAAGVTEDQAFAALFIEVPYES